MNCLAFAADYDGTLAVRGTLHPEMVSHLRELRNSGCKVILITGRIQEDLEQCCPHLELFHTIVFENGAYLYHPESQKSRSLTRSPHPQLIQELIEAQVQPLAIGKHLLATTTDFAALVSDRIQKLHLTDRMILNKESIMILPQGIHKGTGLIAALKEFGIAPEQTYGIGDAENDIDFLELCGRSYAVADAIDSLKALTHRASHRVTQGGAHFGPLEVIQEILSTQRSQK